MMRNLALCMGGALLLVASSAFAQSGFDQAASAYKHGDFKTALSVFRPLAENGDAKAQSILGLMYSYGEGVPVDYQEASRWYRRAAEQGSSVAQYNLGMLYLEGKGVSQDSDEAVKWLTQAADGGHFRARSILAKLDAGTYSYLESGPNDALEAPPTLATTEPEPQSVVMRKPAAPASKSKIAAAAAAPMAVSAAPAQTPAKTSPPSNNHTQVAGTTENSAPAPARAAGDNRQYRVQLAASRSEEKIRSDWSTYQKNYSDIFAGLDASVERAEVGDDKTVWYRLRVGPFASVASAKELCETLSARGIKTGCLPLRSGQ
jgi:cell division septation protein DedD